MLNRASPRLQLFVNEGPGGQAMELGMGYPVAALPTVLLYDAQGRLVRVVRGGEHLQAVLAELE